MSPRRLRRCSAWLLPFLVARLLVPTGFMLSLSGAGLDIVLCSGLGPLALATPAEPVHRAHAGTDHTAHAIHGDAGAQVPEQRSDHPSHVNAICPYALAGTGGAGPAVKSLAEPPRIVSLLPVPSANPAWIAPAVLIDRIRGPPLA